MVIESTGSEKEISNVVILKMEIFFELDAQIERIAETNIDSIDIDIIRIFRLLRRIPRIPEIKMIIENVKYLIESVSGT